MQLGSSGESEQDPDQTPCETCNLLCRNVFPKSIFATLSHDSTGFDKKLVELTFV